MNADTPTLIPSSRRVRIGLADTQTLEVIEFNNDEHAPTAAFRTHTAEPLTPDRLYFDRATEIELVIPPHVNTTQRLALLRTVSIALHGNGIEQCKFACDDDEAQEAVEALAPHLGLKFSRADCTLAVSLETTDAVANTTPLVSIVIAAYNPRYLAAALASVAQQTWKHWELVVCDDHRGDAVRTIVEAFAQRSSQEVRYFKNETALGVRRNYERCFREARGKYVKYLNDDDLLDATCIERLARALERSPTAHLATSHRRRIDERGNPLRDQPATTPVFPDDVYIDGLSLINALLLLGLNFVGEPSTTLIRRVAAAHEGEEIISFLDMPGRGLADMTIWLRLALRGDCVFLADRLSSFRIHNEQQTIASTVTQFALTTIPEFRERWLRYTFHERIPGNLLRTIAYYKAPSTETRNTSSWQFSPIPLFTPPGVNLQQQLADWLAKQHPFFQQESRA